MTARAWAHLYKTKAWKTLRTHQLDESPLCAYHHVIGRTVEARIVDHKIPHKGDEVLFFDADNLQSLCAPCHDRHKQRLESAGVLVGGDANGLPIDPNHHWNV